MLLRSWSRVAAFSCVLIAAGPAAAQGAGAAPSPGSKGALDAAKSGPSGVVLPRVKTQPEVTYPDQALKDGLRTAVTVVLTVDVDAAGAVVKAAVVTPQGHGFDEAAVAAVEKSAFEPARRDGVPFAARIKFEVVFRAPVGGSGAEGQSGAAGAAGAAGAKGGDGSGKRDGDGDGDGDGKKAGGGDKGGANNGAPANKDSAAGGGAAGSGQEVVDVDVRGERQPREVTKRTLTMQEIAVIPGTNGDALRSLQTLPGVARPPPFGGQLIVRGSAPRDTNYFIDGTPVPIVYHFGGLSSVVPTEVLNKIDFYPGNYSAAYGRGMGGLVDVGIRDPKKDGLHGMAQLDLIDARLLAEGPIFKTGWKFMIAGRRSWFDAWLGPVLENIGSPVTTAPRYYDYQVMLENDLTPRSSLRLLFFGSDDAINLLNQNSNASTSVFGGGLDLHTSFWRLQARYENKITDRTEVRAVLAGGQDVNDFDAGTTSSRTTESPISGRGELSQKIMRGVVANVGIDVVVSPYDVQLTRPAPRKPGVPPGGPLEPALSTSQSGSRLFAGSYTEWEIQPWRGMRLVPGVRLDYSSSTKSWDVSPRIFARQDITRGFPRTTLKGGVGLFYQPPQPLETDPVFGQTGLKSNRSLHTDFGVEQELSQQIDLSVDLFYKKLDDLVAASVGNVGDGFAYGAEWLLRYKPDEHFFGWIAYTLSRSERRSLPVDPLAPVPYDQTHILTVLGSYEFGHGFRAGLRFRLVSGNLYTPASEGAYDATVGGYNAVRGYPQNGARLPLFHQLDLRVDKKWQFKSWAFTAYLDIQNVYNAQNPEGVSYNFNYTQQAYVNGLPFLPSFGLRGEL